MIEPTRWAAMSGRQIKWTSSGERRRADAGKRSHGGDHETVDDLDKDSDSIAKLSKVQTRS